VHRLAVVALLACALAPRARATEVVIERIGATSQGYVYVESRVAEPFQDKALEAIRSGLPSTITYTIEVWRKRAGWWDRLEDAREIRVRVLRDLLAEQYVLASREDVRRFPTLDSLAAVACGRRRDYLRPQESNRPYYVIVSFTVAPLSVEDLRELEEWLQGTLRGGDGEGRGGVIGVSGTLVGLLMSATGFGDVTVRGRTATFVPEQVRRDQGVDPESARGGGGGGGSAPRRPRRGHQPSRRRFGKRSPSRARTAATRSRVTTSPSRAPSSTTQPSRRAKRP
jgi:hypothetical protein